MSVVDRRAQLKHVKQILQRFTQPSSEFFVKLEEQEFSPLSVLGTKFLDAVNKTMDNERIKPLKKRKRKNQEESDEEFKMNSEDEVDDEEFEEIYEEMEETELLEMKSTPKVERKVSQPSHMRQLVKKQKKQDTSDLQQEQRKQEITSNISVDNCGAADDVILEFKPSRDEHFSTTIPDVLYTLTWKHKYDLRLNSTKNVFCASEDYLRKFITIALVLADDLQIPKYDRNKVRKRRPNEKKRKRKQKKPKDTTTVEVTSINKISDREIIVRFGINRTFCSKRFGYSPFRLEVKFAGTESRFKPFHFVKYSTMFRTFAKKLNTDTIKNVNAILMKNKSEMLISLNEAEDYIPHSARITEHARTKLVSPAPKQTIKEETKQGTSETKFVETKKMEIPSNQSLVPSGTNGVLDDGIMDGMLLWKCMQTMKERSPMKNKLL